MSSNIILKNKDGTPVTYENVDTVILPLAGGGQAEYSSGSGMVLLPVTTVSGTTLTFSNTSNYSHYCIFYQAAVGYAAQSAVYGFFSYSKPNDNKYHAVYYMSYGGAKFNFTTNNSEDEVKRSGDNFTISSTYTGIGLTWITNTNMGNYWGFFWN